MGGNHRRDPRGHHADHRAAPRDPYGGRRWRPHQRRRGAHPRRRHGPRADGTTHRPRRRHAPPRPRRRGTVPRAPPAAAQRTVRRHRGDESAAPPTGGHVRDDVRLAGPGVPAGGVLPRGRRPDPRGATPGPPRRRPPRPTRDAHNRVHRPAGAPARGGQARRELPRRPARARSDGRGHLVDPRPARRRSHMPSRHGALPRMRRGDRQGGLVHAAHGRHATLPPMGRATRG